MFMHYSHAAMANYELDELELGERVAKYLERENNPDIPLTAIDDLIYERDFGAGEDGTW